SLLDRPLATTPASGVTTPHTQRLVLKGGLTCLRFFVTIVSVARFLPCELACRADQGRSGFFPASIFWSALRGVATPSLMASLRTVKVH
ncbi:hypothetical protein, partial [Mesorhizobium sp. M7D.F.Ca.US.004.01.2.1]|uniref:hypothetical protein n=1 Tax=Mesorhizobium sp. M7D.F.Ca.US.004.01.2.1 TaxID=2496738 RepID=UPI0019CF8805